VGRHVEFARSTSHCFCELQTPEQQSALALHVSPTIAHSLFVQTPPKHPTEQQSCADAHATPSARHASLHWMTPAWPVTGSQSPLQHWGLCVHAAAGARHAPAPPPVPPGELPMHCPLVHVPEQQSKPSAQGPPLGLQAFGP
jgi:hypothetical protein